MRLNERVLRRLGGNWRQPPSLPPGWEAAEELAGEREEARALLDATFADRPLWGWKDPRNCLTVPLWRGMLPQTRFVLCLRNPLDVAASLERRDGLDAETSFGLWATYLAAALVNTAGAPRLLVRYEDFFADWRRTADRLFRFVGVEPPPAGSEAEQRIDATLNRHLWRHRTAPAEVLADPRLPREALSLYVAVELLGAAGQGASGAERLAELEAMVDSYAASLR